MAVTAVGDHCKLSARAAGSELHICSFPKFTATLILFQTSRASYTVQMVHYLWLALKGQETLSAWQMD